tara:strand:- start:369 stop:539 length:171 start_codon:yes stop_codon:yes gene_type:complete
MTIIEIGVIQILLAVPADTLENLETCYVYYIYRVKNIHENALSKQSMTLALAKATK